MRKRLSHIALFMAGIFFLQGVSLAVMYSQFRVHADILEEKFCINKDQTDFECGGQCYFMKKMKATSGHHNPAEEELMFSVSFHPVYLENTPYFFFHSFKDVFLNEKFLSPFPGFSGKVFQPPESSQG